MAYLDLSNEVGRMDPWPQYDIPQSFRVGSTPALCNAYPGLHCPGDDKLGEGTYHPDTDRWFKQMWSTTQAARNFIGGKNTDASVNPIKDSDVFGDYGGDTSLDTVGHHSYEITSNWSNTFKDIKWRFPGPVANRINLNNWSEFNCMAGTFLAHPDFRTLPSSRVSRDSVTRAAGSACQVLLFR